MEAKDETETKEQLVKEAEKKPDHFLTIVAILLAVLSLVGGFIAKEVRGPASSASSYDRAGLDAERNVQMTLALNNSILHQHYRAYTGYLVHSELEERLAQQVALSDSEVLRQEYAEAVDLATTDQIFFPTRYLNRDGSYAIDRELGEAWAQASQVMDLDPAAHFEVADQQRVMSKWMLLLYIGVPIALLVFKVSQSIHAERHRLRVGLLGVGAVLYVVSILLVLNVDKLF